MCVCVCVCVRERERESERERERERERGRERGLILGFQQRVTLILSACGALCGIEEGWFMTLSEILFFQLVSNLVCGMNRIRLQLFKHNFSAS